MDVVKGNLFDHPGAFIGHGCNAKGTMGAGIAKEFRYRWPDMYQEYRELCLVGDLRPGEVFPYDTGYGAWKSPLYVMNLVSQDLPGSNAQAGLIHLAVTSAAGIIEGLIEDGETSDNTLALPWIGCGIGGLDQAVVADVLKWVEASHDIEILVYELD